MKTLRAKLLCGLFAYIFAGYSFANNLKGGFVSPPDSARVHTWWHRMNGNITKEGITKDLEAMKAAGLGGFQAFDVPLEIPKGPVKYDSREWHDLMAHTAREADRLGLEMCIHNCAGWSNTGGPWIKPEHSMQEVVWTEQQVKGPGELTVVLEQPTTKKDFYRDIAILAFPTPKSELGDKTGFRISEWQLKTGAVMAPWFTGKVIKMDRREPNPADVIAVEHILNLTGKSYKEGRLTWKVPAGTWTIIRMGYTTTGRNNHPAPPEGQGLESDKLSKEGADLHWNNIISRVIADAGPVAGKTFKNILIDSYEVGHQNWTREFPEEFRKRRGYDITPWLVCMTGRATGSIERSERFMWDIRRTIADLMKENYFGRFAELCHENGLVLSVEPYGNGGFDGFQAAATADIPMGEFWVKPLSVDFNPDFNWAARLVASAAHFGGKKYVGAESFTARDKNAAWIQHPYSLKAQGDYYYTLGINRFIFHTFVHQPWPDTIVPGMTMSKFGMQMNRNNTWFLRSRPWFDHLARCQYLLQEGRNVTDLLYIFGEDAPTMAKRLEHMNPAPPTGYSFDCGGFETLMQLSVKDGRLVLPSGAQYSVLILTQMERVRPELLQKISELVRAGASVVGLKPSNSPSLENYPECDKTVGRLAGDLWGRRLIYNPENFEALLAEMNLPPDFETQGQTDVGFVHRRIGENEVYFVANQLHTQRKITCLFRAAGRLPELWHPKDGRVERAAVWQPAGGNRTSVTNDFEPVGSVFVVFREPTLDIDPIAEASFRPGNAKIAKNPGAKASLEITRAWYGDSKDASRQVDVTDALANKVRDGYLTVTADSKEFGDPAPQAHKTLVLDYILEGKPETLKVAEGQKISLGPTPAAFSYRPDLEMRVENGLESALVFKPGELALRRASGNSEQIMVSDIPEPVELTQSWTVSFGKMGPDSIVTLKSLIPWNEHENELIRYYSGPATYRAAFEIQASRLDAGYCHVLDLGDVQVMAEVKLNGKDLGLLWKPPFVADVTGALKEGLNNIEVTVVNLWPNRLIGDEQYPESVLRPNGGGVKEIPAWVLEGRLPPESKRRTFAAWKHWSKDDPLLKSGLIGPVRLLSGKVVRLKNGPESIQPSEKIEPGRLLKERPAGGRGSGQACTAEESSPVVGVQDKIVAQAHPFSLDQVQLLEGPFKNAQQTNRKYLLAIDVDLLTYPFRREAQLPTPVTGRDDFSFNYNGTQR